MTSGKDVAKAIVYLDLGPRKWALRFGFAEIAEYERLMGGMPLHQIISSGRVAGVDALVKALMVAMRKQDPRISESKICKYLDEDPGKFKDALESVVTAIGQVLVDNKEHDDDVPLAVDEEQVTAGGIGISSSD